MKISICIPQYNRIEFLEKSLQGITGQEYMNIEVIVSDDASVDDTPNRIASIQKTYKFPLIYERSEVNLGYDRNLRRSMELATGDYCLILGNDDTLHHPNAITDLVHFLEEQGRPELGFCNYVEDLNRDFVVRRANKSAVLGTGYEVALQNFSNFSFVAGLIYRRDIFSKHNTNRFDGSIFIQMYFACLMIASGSRLFSYAEPVVIKDLQIGDLNRGSYKDKLARSWKHFREVQGGLDSVINVLIMAFYDAGVLNKTITYKIFNRIYSATYPHWLLDYRGNGALPEAVGLSKGLRPWRMNHFEKLSAFHKIWICVVYGISTFVGLLFPVLIYNRIKPVLYRWLRRKG